MKSFRGIVSGALSVVTLALIKVSTVAAQTGGLQAGLNSARGVDQPAEIFGDGAIFENIVNTFLFVVGAVAVIMIVHAGFRYVTSGGNSANVTAAKNTILYAVVGVVVALLAYAILDFVLMTFQGGSNGSTAGL